MNFLVSNVVTFECYHKAYAYFCFDFCKSIVEMIIVTVVVKSEYSYQPVTGQKYRNHVLYGTEAVIFSINGLMD